MLKIVMLQEITGIHQKCSNMAPLRISATFLYMITFLENCEI